MRKGSIIAALLLASAALAGLLGYLLVDDGPGVPSLPSEKGRSADKGGEPGGFSDGDFPGASAAAAGQVGTGLTPEQEAKLRAALERMGNEAAIRSALSADVPEPWPLPEAQKQFATCLTSVEQGLPTNRETARQDICACATRAIQRTYPKEPPQPGTRRGKKTVGATFRAALEECINPQ